MRKPKLGLLAVFSVIGLILGTVVTQTHVARASVQWGSPSFVYDPGGQKYSYAPSAVLANGNTYYYTCHNAVDSQIKDHIYFTQVNTPGAPPQQDYSLFTGSGSGWDGNHTCDPSVVAGNFGYNGTQYGYAMFYLGTDLGNSHNQIGVAFANALGGPWVRYPQPIVTSDLPNTSQWGVGQPTATTVDAATGRVLLFYGQDANVTDGSTAGRSAYDRNLLTAYRRDITLGNMNAPLIGPAVEITNAGLTGTDGAQDRLHNFDVAYDPTRDRFYVARERYPFPWDDPWYISTEVEIDSIPASSIWNGGGTWQQEALITPSMTGFARNHNPGILRTIYGTLPDSSNLTTVFTRGDAVPANLWSYDLHKITGPLDNYGMFGLRSAAPNNRCLDNPNGNTTNATQFFVYSCYGGPNQRFVYTTGKALRIYGKCVDALGSTSGSSVAIYDCHGGTNQQWNMNANGTITSVQSGLCLDAYNAVNDTSNGRPVVVYTCTGGANQVWPKV